MKVKMALDFVKEKAVIKKGRSTKKKAAPKAEAAAEESAAE